MTEYGITFQNPIKSKHSVSALTMLDNIVTTNGFHILYHFKDYIIRQNAIIEVYEVFSEDKNLFVLYFDVTSEIDIWIPPTGFLFQYEWIPNEVIFYHGQDYYYKDGCTHDNAMVKFDSMEESVFEWFIFENVGVNYRSNNFPYSMYQKYLDEYTYKKRE